jgi:hypothetical protein
MLPMPVRKFGLNAVATAIFAPAAYSTTHNLYLTKLLPATSVLFQLYAFILIRNTPLSRLVFSFPENQGLI